MIPYQYGQNFDVRDHNGVFVAHPGEWLTIRLPERDQSWSISQLPLGFQLDMELWEEFTEERIRVLSIRVDEDAPLQRGNIAIRSGGKWWQANFDVVPG